MPKKKSWAEPWKIKMVEHLRMTTKEERIDAIKVPFLGTIPADDEVMKFDYNGTPLLELKDDSPVYQAVAAMLDQTLGL